jgi:hypothetical protein
MMYEFLMHENNKREAANHISQIIVAFLCLFAHFHETAYQVHTLELNWI